VAFLEKIPPEIAGSSALNALFSGVFDEKLFSEKNKKKLHPPKKLISFPALFLLEKGR
jgi:hypothetical protein